MRAVFDGCGHSFIILPESLSLEKDFGNDGNLRKLPARGCLFVVGVVVKKAAKMHPNQLGMWQDLANLSALEGRVAANQLALENIKRIERFLGK